jgi:hypothetical protein
MLGKNGIANAVNRPQIPTTLRAAKSGRRDLNLDIGAIDPKTAWRHITTGIGHVRRFKVPSIEGWKRDLAWH